MSWNPVRTPRSIALAAVALLAGSTACGGGAEERELQGATAHLERRPVPVILFLVDTLRADHLGCYGYERDTSPNLDALAADGVVFESCQAQSSWTKPSSASVLTGLLPSQHGAVHKVSALAERHLLLAEPLSEAGYDTAGFGSNGFVFGLEQGFSRGFDTFLSGGVLIDHQSPHEVVDAEVLVEAALEQLEAWQADGGDEPFLLYVHAVDPHDPYEPPADLARRWSEPLDERLGPDWPTDEVLARPGPVLGRYGKDIPPEVVQRMRDLYDGEIADADRALGRLLDGLRQRGLYDEALVIFVSDHGEEFQDHGGFGHNPRLFQEVTRVPLVVKFPASFGPPPGGPRFDGRVRQVDLLPTVLDTLGLELPEEHEAEMAGKSMLPSLFGGVDWGDPPAVTEVDYEGVFRRSLIVGDLKYVRTWVPHPEERLYDLGVDPEELNDLAAERPDVVVSMRADLARLADLGDRGWGLLLRNRTDQTVPVAGLLTYEGEPLEGLDGLHLELGHPDPLKLDGALGQGFLRFEPSTTGTDRLVITEGTLEGGGTERRVLGLEMTGMEPYAGKAAWFLATLGVGDDDGILFVPSEGTEGLELHLWIGGQPVPAEYVFLGAELAPAPAMPLAFEGLEGHELPAEPPRKVTPEDTPLFAWVWRNMAPETLDVELSPETEQNLRDLGYFGDDE